MSQKRRAAHFLREALQALNTIIEHLDEAEPKNAELVATVKAFITRIHGGGGNAPSGA